MAIVKEAIQKDEEEARPQAAGGNMLSITDYQRERE